MNRTIEEDIFGGKRKQPINQKQKGNRNELVVAHLLSEWTGHEFTRVPRSGGLRWKNTVNICGDVISTDPSFDFPYSVETKHLKHIGFNYEDIISSGITILNPRTMMLKIWKQAEVDASRSDKRPMLLIRHNDMPEKEYFMFIRLFDPLNRTLIDAKIPNRISMLKKWKTMIDVEQEVIWGYLFSDVMKIPYKK